MMMTIYRNLNKQPLNCEDDQDLTTSASSPTQQEKKSVDKERPTRAAIIWNRRKIVWRHKPWLQWHMTRMEFRERIFHATQGILRAGSYCEPLDVSRVHGAICRCLPEMAKCEYRVVEITEIPFANRYKVIARCPLRNTLLYKAWSNDYDSNKILIRAGFRVELTKINGRISGFELVPHLWIQNTEDGTWIDTTPSNSEDESQPLYTRSILFAATDDGLCDRFNEAFPRLALLFDESNDGSSLDTSSSSSDSDPEIPSSSRHDAERFSTNCKKLFNAIDARGEYVYEGMEMDVCADIYQDRHVIYTGPGSSRYFNTVQFNCDVDLGCLVGPYSFALQKKYKCCWNCWKPNAAFSCGGCRIYRRHHARYCSSQCQLADWRAGHKRECLRLDKKK